MYLYMTKMMHDLNIKGVILHLKQTKSYELILHLEKYKIGIMGNKEIIFILSNDIDVVMRQWNMYNI